jgi:hypothetical protein
LVWLRKLKTASPFVRKAPSKAAARGAGFPSFWHGFSSVYGPFFTVFHRFYGFLKTVRRCPSAKNSVIRTECLKQEFAVAAEYLSSAAMQRSLCVLCDLMFQFCPSKRRALSRGESRGKVCGAKAWFLRGLRAIIFPGTPGGSFF